MARFGRTGPYLEPRPGSRPRRLLPSPWRDRFNTDIHEIVALKLDGEDAVVLIPYIDYREDPIADDPEAKMPEPRHSDMLRVWKTTVLYG